MKGLFDNYVIFNKGAAAVFYDFRPDNTRAIEFIKRI